MYYIFLALILFPLSYSQAYTEDCPSSEELVLALMRGEIKFYKCQKLFEPNPFYGLLLKLSNSLNDGNDQSVADLMSELSNSIPLEGDSSLIPDEVRWMEGGFDEVDAIGAAVAALVLSGRQAVVIASLANLLGRDNKQVTQRGLLASFMLNGLGSQSLVSKHVEVSQLCFLDGAPYDSVGEASFAMTLKVLSSSKYHKSSAQEIVKQCGLVVSAEDLPAFVTTISFLPQALLKTSACLDVLQRVRSHSNPVIRAGVYRGLARARELTHEQLLQAFRSEPSPELRRFLARVLWTLSEDDLLNVAQSVLEQEKDLGVHRSINSILNQLITGKLHRSLSELIVATPATYAHSLGATYNKASNTNLAANLRAWAEAEHPSMVLEGKRALISYFSAERESMLDIRKARLLMRDPAYIEMFPRGVGFFLEPALIPLFDLINQVPMQANQRLNFDNIYGVLKKTATNEWSPSKVCRQMTKECLHEAIGVDYLRNTKILSLADAESWLSVAISPLQYGYSIENSHEHGIRIVHTPKQEKVSWRYADSNVGWTKQ